MVPPLSRPVSVTQRMSIGIENWTPIGGQFSMPIDSNASVRPAEAAVAAMVVFSPGLSRPMSQRSNIHTKAAVRSAPVT